MSLPVTSTKNIPVNIQIDELTISSDASAQLIRKNILDALTQQWSAQNILGKLPEVNGADQLLTQAADKLVAEVQGHLKQSSKQSVQIKTEKPSIMPLGQTP